MTGQSALQFQWLSPLGVSVALFLLFGVLHVGIGVLAPLLTRSAAEPPPVYLLFSERSDTALFGAPPAQIAREHRALGLLRWLLLCWLAAVLFAFGVLQLAVAWFALRPGQTWALWALTVANLATLPYWAGMIRVYVRHGAPLGMGDLPPLFLYLALVPVAAVLGWRGIH